MTRLDLIQELPPNQMGVEVGCLYGEFAQQMLNTGNIEKLLLIDPYQHQDSCIYNDVANVAQNEMDARYNALMQKFEGDSRVEIRREFSRMFIPHGFDFVYIDANHAYNQVLADILFYSQFVPLIFCHDFIEHPDFGVDKAVNKFLKANTDWKLTCVTNEEWPTARLERI